MSSRRNPAANDDWQTPPNIRELVDSFALEMGFDRITLDPATTRENPMGAEFIRTPDCDPDGLETEWFELLSDKPRFVYVNPPYRAAWYKKIELEAIRMRSAHTNCQMVALLPAKPGTKYFADLAQQMDAACFITGRLTFKGAPDQAPFENALLYFGRKRHHFRAAVDHLGWVI